MEYINYVWEIIKNFMAMPVVQHSIGLLFLWCANTVVGVSKAKYVDKNWDVNIFYEGIKKNALIVFATILVYIAGSFNPDIIAINFDGVDFTLCGAVNVLVLAEYAQYSADIVSKIWNIKVGKPVKKILNKNEQ